jgi:hypothetical protein
METQAQLFGVQLDPAKSVIHVPVLTASDGGVVPAAEIGVSFTPPVETILYVEGAALAFNVSPGALYMATVTRAGQRCAADSHPELVASDGSVPIGTLGGAVTVMPAVMCP